MAWRCCKDSSGTAALLATQQGGTRFGARHGVFTGTLTGTLTGTIPATAVLRARRAPHPLIHFESTHNMKILTTVTALTLALASSFALAQQAGTAAPQAYQYNYKTPKLDRAKLDALLARPDQVLIIDVRRPDELTSIGGFPVYLSIQLKELEQSLPFIPKERSIVTVSNHAGRAGAAGDLLAAKGFKVAGALGAQNYEEEGGTLSKIARPAPKPVANAGAAPAAKS